MFNSSILDVVIGLVFCYASVALFVSAINEAIASALKLRHKTLFTGIKEMLNDPQGAGLAAKLYNHALISPLAAGRPGSPRVPDVRPAYIPSQAFARALIDVVQGVPGDIASVKELAPDTGAVIRSGISKLAVYRDARGNLHQRSAVCPHLGAIVRWNQADRTFDCPCYGSRFDCYGRVINGPASRDLARVWELEAGLRRPEPMFSGTGLTTDTSW